MTVLAACLVLSLLLSFFISVSSTGPKGFLIMSLALIAMLTLIYYLQSWSSPYGL